MPSAEKEPTRLLFRLVGAKCRSMLGKPNKKMEFT